MNYQLLEQQTFSTYQQLVRPTRYMVRQRTIELALKDGRAPHEIKQADYEQAKRELTGESDFSRQQEILDGWG